MDLIAHGELELLESLGARPGTMNLVDEERRDRLLARIRISGMIPGGSAANTLRGIAWLAGGGEPPPLYSGAVGSDELGSQYEDRLQGLGVRTHIVRKRRGTGVSTIIVTPDHERTMFTCLGASQELDGGDLGGLPEAALLYFTGYMWDTAGQRQAVQARAEQARGRGVPVAFDLADPFAVERFRDAFLSWIPGRVDVVFGNRDEVDLVVGAHAGGDEGLALKAGFLAPVVVIKIGAEGCLVNDHGRILRSAGCSARVVDTIGAGDFFAAGYLYGLLRGLPTEDCACLANAMGAAIVAVEGCGLDSLDRAQVLGPLRETSPRGFDRLSR